LPKRTKWAIFCPPFIRGLKFHAIRVRFVLVIGRPSADNLSGSCKAVGRHPSTPIGDAQAVTAPPAFHPDLINEFSAKFLELTDLIFVDGALPAKTKELMAIAAAEATLCEHCTQHHTRRALQLGATRNEITEAIWVGIAVRAGAAVVRSKAAFTAIDQAGR